jgi:hypothetical protein
MLNFGKKLQIFCQHLVSTLLKALVRGGSGSREGGGGDGVV